MVHSILLYGAEVWSEQLTYKKFRRKLATVQRQAALRVVCAYRTVSEAAILVISKAIPIDHLANERKVLYGLRTAGTLSQNRRVTERENTLDSWEKRWHDASTGRWTARLIPKLDTWLKCNHAETNYHLTQFLTNHENFNGYLHRMGLKSSPLCSYCPTCIDDANYTFFHCHLWATEQREY